jgi:hypothetical protein
MISCLMRPRSATGSPLSCAHLRISARSVRPLPPLDEDELRRLLPERAMLIGAGGPDRGSVAVDVDGTSTLITLLGVGWEED